MEAEGEKSCGRGEAWASLHVRKQSFWERLKAIQTEEQAISLLLTMKYARRDGSHADWWLLDELIHAKDPAPGP